MAEGCTGWSGSDGEGETDGVDGEEARAGHARRWRWPVAARRDRGAAQLVVPLSAARQGACDGLGGFPAVSLTDARGKAEAARRLLAAGIDPIDQREAARQAEAAELAQATTFAEAARPYIEAHEAGWRNDKHAAQWRSTIETYAAPTLGTLACTAITTADILAVLKPIWSTKPETAARLRGRLEMILSYAKAHGWRDGQNLAIWVRTAAYQHRQATSSFCPARAGRPTRVLTPPCRTFHNVRGSFATTLGLSLLRHPSHHLNHKRSVRGLPRGGATRFKIPSCRLYRPLPTLVLWFQCP